ncbi:hypothetical protein [Pedobacter sp. NJ-S-72]
MAVVDQGQSLFDVAVQHCGDVSAVFELAHLNSLSITDKLKAGSELILPIPVDSGLVKYFQDNSYVPATDINEKNEIILPDGIDYWAVGIDFIVM